jgi:hypothetical protein
MDHHPFAYLLATIALLGAMTGHLPWAVFPTVTTLVVTLAATRPGMRPPTPPDNNGAA